MRLFISFVAAVLLGLIATQSSQAKELAELKVLYIGSRRAAEYVDFLREKVAHVESKGRHEFKPTDADAFDVVLFDWPQSEETREMRKLTSPLGAREAWHKPTVLLGSAGLNLAVAWKLKGGSGCTCLEPMAYDLREHEIFERPFAIDRGLMISIATPPDFEADIDDEKISVLSLAENGDWKGHNGWCTYANDFARNPDVEFFCGGVNHKTPTAAGLWRQGNLLHFGFELAPPEMNESAQRLLLNSIAYISRFSEDRPIAVTPSVFAGPIVRPRATLARWLRSRDSRDEWVKDLVSPEVLDQLSSQGGPEQMAKWAEEHAKFLHPSEDLKLVIDKDLVALGVAFDVPEFFAVVLADLHSKDDDAAVRARRLLERYVPSGPQNGDADAWTAWWNDNRRYAFASDAGDYRWYVDGLAKKRGVPADELRGPKRADGPALSLTGGQ